jgi:antirestriction protein ArdC
MTAAMLCGAAGIEQKTLENTAAYLKTWIVRLKSDSRLLVSAASQAQKAADFIQGKPPHELDEAWATQGFNRPSLNRNGFRVCRLAPHSEGQ